MPRLVAMLCGAALVVGCKGSPQNSGSGDAPANAMAPVAFMEGNWRADHDGVVTEERWSPPQGGMMLATALTVQDNKAVFFEFLRVESRPSGLVYVAQPKGRPPTDFVLSESSTNSATFTNPTHDFPKRIQYRRNGDTMMATVDGGSTAGAQGGPPAQVFMMKRQP